MTQTNLSDGICSCAYLSKIENNQVKPKPKTMVKLAKQLDLPIGDWLNYYLGETTGLSFSEYLYLARVLMKRNLFEEAVECIELAEHVFRSMQNDAPYTFRCQFLETTALLDLHQEAYTSTLQKYQKLLAMRKRRPSCRYELAHAYFLLGNTFVHLGD